MHSHRAPARSISYDHRQVSYYRRGDTCLADLLLGLAERKRFGLREEVGEEDAVVE